MSSPIDWKQGSILQVQSSLRPSKLSSEANASEFGVWSKAFRQYFFTSNMRTINIYQQRGFLESCLDAKLVHSLEREVSESCNILGSTGSCMAALDGLIKERHPIFNQRADCLKMIQTPGQTRADFVNHVVDACRDAEMANMTPDQLVAHIILAGLSDLKTKEKCHELDDPSIKELRRTAKRLDTLEVKIKQLVPNSKTVVVLSLIHI